MLANKLNLEKNKQNKQVIQTYLEIAVYKDYNIKGIYTVMDADVAYFYKSATTFFSIEKQGQSARNNDGKFICKMSLGNNSNTMK